MSASTIPHFLIHTPRTILRRRTYRSKKMAKRPNTGTEGEDNGEQQAMLAARKFSQSSLLSQGLADKINLLSPSKQNLPFNDLMREIESMEEQSQSPFGKIPAALTPTTLGAGSSASSPGGSVGSGLITPGGPAGAPSLNLNERFGKGGGKGKTKGKGGGKGKGKGAGPPKPLDFKVNASIQEQVAAA